MSKEFSKIYVFLDDRDRDLPTITRYELNQEEAEEINKRGYGIFQTVNSFDLTKPLLTGEKTFRCESHLSRLDYVYADLDIAKRGDGQTDEQKKTKKEAKLQEVLPFKPTMVMETANGIQPYWKIADGEVNTESKLKCENIICSIIDKFNGDPGAKDLSRILRMPNFYHNKGTPFLCKIIHKEDIEYTLDGLLQLFPFTAKANENIKNKTDFWEALKQGFPEGNRHSAFLSLCLSMLKGKYEKDFDNVWLVMESTYHQNVKDTNGFSLNDAKICFRQACKYAKDWDQGIITSEHKIISLNEILKLTPKQNPFLLQGMIVEGSVNALTSDSGKGKSLLMLKMAEAIATGEKFLGEFETKKSKILIVDLEMSEDDVIGRTQSIIGHEVEGIDFHHSQSFNILNDDDFKWLKNTVLANGYRLVVLDTYSMAAGSKNENDNAEANLVNKRFLELTNECGCTILFLHHHRKLQKGEIMSQSTSRGATDIIGKTASHLLIDTRDIFIAEGQDGQKGIKIIVEQMKRRRATGFDRFSINIWYSISENKSYFNFGGYDEKAENALSKTKGLILGKMENGEEYMMKNIKEMANKDSHCVYAAMKELVDIDGVVGFRFPQPDETLENGHKIPVHTKIYFLNIKNEE